MSKDSKFNTNICCVGAGYVGGPSMVVIADKCPNIKVTVVDLNEKRINNWNDKNFENIPIFEPNLIPLLKKTRNKNLFFSTNIEREISLADIIFICVNTPTKKSGIGAGRASDLKYIESCAKQIALHSKGNTIVVEKSTVPVKTAEVIQNILNKDVNTNLDINKTFSVLSNPEFLSEGNAINDLQNPDRVLIGGNDSYSINCLSSIYEKWIDKERIIKTNLWSSELSKLTANAFLAQRISSINSISAICEKTGADIKEVAKAIGGDKRIGENFLSPGPGFGGSCFKKDLLNLVYLCEYYNLQEVADYWTEILKINEWQQKRISKIIIDKFSGNISGKIISIFGFAFKANTNDTRESPSINICKDLIEAGANLKIYDPKVSKFEIKSSFNTEFEPANDTDQQNILKSLNEHWSYVDNLYECADNANAIVILTEWREFMNLDWSLIEMKMKKDSWIFDTRLITNQIAIKKTEIKLWRLGNQN